MGGKIEEEGNIQDCRSHQRSNWVNICYDCLHICFSSRSSPRLSEG